MPGTSNGSAVEFPLGKRSSQVRTLFREDKDSSAAFHHQDRDPVRICFAHDVFLQLRFAEQRGKFVRQFFGRVIDADTLVVDEMAAEKSSGNGETVADKTGR